MARIQRENLREQILDAAEKRLWHFGLKKTTIDEVASDAGVGKGTVYLYFESKEDIAIAIMARYKEDILLEQTEIARDRKLSPGERLHSVVSIPIMRAYTKCNANPQAMEVIIMLKPHLAQRMQPYSEQEVALIAEVIEDGNQQGIYKVADTMTVARTVKRATSGFLPPYPCVSDEQEIERELRRIVDMAIRSFRP